MTQTTNRPRKKPQREANLTPLAPAAMPAAAMDTSMSMPPGVPDADAPAAPISNNGSDLDDIATVDARLLAAAEQLSAVRSEIAQLRKAREAAVVRREAEQLQRALQQFAKGEALSNADFLRVMDAVQRDPRAQVAAVPATARPMFYEALIASQELLLLGHALDADDSGRLVTTLVDGYAPTPEEKADIRTLTEEIAAAEAALIGGVAPEKQKE